MQQIATQATVIPLSVFTNLLHQRFPKHKFFELTLALLQQFYLCVEEASDDTYKMFPGDKYCTSLKCVQCNQRVTSAAGRIIDTLVQAPTAILQHFHILETHQVGHDSDETSFEALPLMYTSSDSYMASKQTFERGIDSNDGVLLKSVFCKSSRDEDFKFCEAVKVDASNSSKKKYHDQAVAHSMALVKVLFEDIYLSQSCEKFHSSHLVQPNIEQNCRSGEIYGYRKALWCLLITK